MGVSRPQGEQERNREKRAVEEVVLQAERHKLGRFCLCDCCFA